MLVLGIRWDYARACRPYISSLSLILLTSLSRLHRQCHNFRSSCRSRCRGQGRSCGRSTCYSRSRCRGPGRCPGRFRCREVIIILIIIIIIIKVVKYSYLYNNLDSTGVLIGQQMCFHWAMKHKNDLSDTPVLLSPSCENLQFHERNKAISTRFVYRLLFVKSKNYNFVKELKHVFRAFIGWWKPSSLICSRIPPNVHFGFHPLYSTRKMFYFVYIILIKILLPEWQP